MTKDAVILKNGFTFNVAPQANWPDPTIKFLEAPEIKDIARQLITKFRDDLQNVNIGYVFKQKASKAEGSPVPGEAKTQNDLQKTLHGLEAVIVIGYDNWCTLDPDDKFRVVLEELEKLVRDEDGKITKAELSVQASPLVMKHFGPYNDAQIALINAYNAFTKDHTKVAAKIITP